MSSIFVDRKKLHPLQNTGFQALFEDRTKDKGTVLLSGTVLPRRAICPPIDKKLQNDTISAQG
jgi:hypothetical protein